MRLRNTSEAYGAIAKTLHWSVVFLVIVSWGTGQLGDEGPVPERVNLFIHIIKLSLVAFMLQ